MTTIPEIPNRLQPEEIVQQLRAMRQHIPDFVLLPVADRLSLRRAASVDPHWVQTTINAIGASDALQAALGKTADDLRLDAEFTIRWGAVADELQATLDGVRSAVTVRRHRLGVTALQAYQISRQLVRQKEHADLLPHIAAMRERSKFARKRVKPEETTATPPPTSPPVQAKPQT
jgi:hypothetical protein